MPDTACAQDARERESVVSEAESVARKRETWLGGAGEWCAPGHGAYDKNRRRTVVAPSSCTRPMQSGDSCSISMCIRKQVSPGAHVCCFELIGGRRLSQSVGPMKKLGRIWPCAHTASRRGRVGAR